MPGIHNVHARAEHDKTLSGTGRDTTLPGHPNQSSFVCHPIPFSHVQKILYPATGTRPKCRYHWERTHVPSSMSFARPPRFRLGNQTAKRTLLQFHVSATDARHCKCPPLYHPFPLHPEFSVSQTPRRSRPSCIPPLPTLARFSHSPKLPAAST